MYKNNDLRKHRYSSLESIYSVTFCTNKRQPFLIDFHIARIVINAMRFQDLTGRTKTWAYVLMPDHVHWLFTLKQSQLSKVIHSVKSFSSQEFGQGLWQKDYYEHQVRKEEDLVKLSRYIVANPLRAKLVTTIGDYPFWDAIWINHE